MKDAADHIAQAAYFQDILDAQIMNTEPYAPHLRAMLRGLIEYHVQGAMRAREIERAAQEVEQRTVTSSAVN